jgi:hypothetical protein
MKLCHIVESRSVMNVPVSIEHRMQVQNPQLESGWDQLDVVVSGVVSIERDPFGTGDSPTEYYFEPQTVVSETTNQAINPNTISDEEWNIIDDKACARAATR